MKLCCRQCSWMAPLPPPQFSVQPPRTRHRPHIGSENHPTSSTPSTLVSHHGTSPATKEDATIYNCEHNNPAAFKLQHSAQKFVQNSVQNARNRSEQAKTTRQRGFSQYRTTKLQHTRNQSNHPNQNLLFPRRKKKKKNQLPKTRSPPQKPTQKRHKTKTKMDQKSGKETDVKISCKNTPKHFGYNLNTARNRDMAAPEKQSTTNREL